MSSKISGKHGSNRAQERSERRKAKAQKHDNGNGQQQWPEKDRKGH